MNKTIIMNPVVIVGVVVILILLVGIVVLLAHVAGRKKEEDDIVPDISDNSTSEDSTPVVQEECPLVNVSYTSSGNSIGNYFAISAKRAGLVVILKVKSGKAEAGAQEEKEYPLDDNVLRDVYAVISKYDMTSYGKLPMGKPSADAKEEAPTVAISFRVDKKTVNVFSSQELPEGGLEAFEEIYENLIKYTDGSIVK